MKKSDHHSHRSVVAWPPLAVTIAFLVVAWTTSTVIIQQVDSKPHSPLAPPSSNYEAASVNSVYGNSIDSCDWEGSGLSQKSSDRVVVPIYLRCSQGTVRWLYPTGALQVTLKHGSHSGGEFRGCIRIARNVSSRVRLYVEGITESLYKLYSPDDGKSLDLARCFVSHSGSVALYLEADQLSPLVKKEFFQFSYHLEPVHSKKALSDDSFECRPCSDYEMHTSYCTSDFVIRGSISSLYNNEALQLTELTVRASEVKRDLFPSFSTNSTSKTNGNGNNKQIVLYRPLKCHSKAGLNSEFLFIGHWVLGNPVIKCAPHLSYWKHVKSRATAAAANQCQLD